MLNNIVLCLFICALTVLATRLVLKYLLQFQVVDQPDPNIKVHKTETVRGGGLAFAMIIIAFIALQHQLLQLSALDALTIVVTLLLLSCTGFVDDIKSISARIRISIQFIAALILVSIIQKQYGFVINANIVIYGLPLLLLVAGGVVWSINIYNFCDGIDGYIASEVASTCLLMCLICYLLGSTLEINALLLVIASALIGFLYYNKQPAQLFMGDVGSYFIGSILVIIAILLWRQGQHYLHAWMIMQSIPIVDSSITLIRRYLASNPLMEPHRSHAYQNAYVKFSNNAYIVIAINFLVKLLFVSPLAFVVLLYQMPFYFVFLAYIPALIFVLYFQGGVNEQHINDKKLLSRQ